MTNSLSDPNVSYINGNFPYVFRVFWLLGNFCPYECSYCTPYLHSGSAPYHNIDVVLNTMKKLPKSRICFSGGEPTYHPDFERIVKEKPEHIDIGLLSNAARPLSYWERIAPNLKFSVLTYHIEYAQYDRFLSIAELLYKTHALGGRVNLTMLPSRWDECVEVYNRLVGEGIGVVAKPILEYLGKEAKRMVVDYSDEQIEWMTNSSQPTDIESSPIYAYNTDGELLFTTSCTELLSSKQTNFKGWQCDLPSKYLLITSTGDIFNTTCPQGTKLGNIHTDFKFNGNSITCNQNFCSCFLT